MLSIVLNITMCIGLTAYAWVYLGDAANPYTLFDLTAGRRQEFPQQFHFRL